MAAHVSRKRKIYIDGANLYNASRFLDWELDYTKLYTWLTDKFNTKEIFLFIGFVEENKALYAALESIGYLLIFKHTLRHKGVIKGNCDAELVLKAVTDIIREPFDDFVLVSSDGDFSCLLEFAQSEKKTVHVVSPSGKLSYLIRRLDLKVTFLRDLKNLLSVNKEKTPDGHRRP